MHKEYEYEIPWVNTSEGIWCLNDSDLDVVIYEDNFSGWASNITAHSTATFWDEVLPMCIVTTLKKGRSVRQMSYIVLEYLKIIGWKPKTWRKTGTVSLVFPSKDGKDIYSWFSKLEG